LLKADTSRNARLLGLIPTSLTVFDDYSFQAVFDTVLIDHFSMRLVGLKGKFFIRKIWVKKNN
jgi:hypothetical protein